MELQIDDDHQASTVSCSSAAASPQAFSEAPPKPSTIEQTVVKIVEDLMDVVTIVTADHETPPKKTKKLRSVAANIERVGEMLAKELEAMEKSIMSAEAKASVDDSFKIESFDAVLKMLENMVQDNGKE